MRELIITQAIESLRRDGLKFSVDTIARTLNVSKKTIYKYFPDKQSLAIALYERYYSDACARIRELIGDNSQSAERKLLWQYYDAKFMTRGEIFNKYKLNAALKSYTEEHNARLFKVIYPALSANAECDEETCRIIIDATFEKLCTLNLDAEEAITFLLKALL